MLLIWQKTTDDRTPCSNHVDSACTACVGSLVCLTHAVDTCQNFTLNPVVEFLTLSPHPPTPKK